MILPNHFEDYLLENLKVSRKTLRNYRSDLAHFMGWSGAESIEEAGKNFTARLVGQYKGWHLENKIPAATANRRLSTLRNFAKFLKSQNLLFFDPTEVIENLRLKEEPTAAEKLEALIAEYRNHLEEQGVSKSTLKNYLSDTRQFLLFAAQEGGR